MKIWGCKPEERIKEGSRLARALRRSIHHWIRRWNANCNGGAGCSSTNDRLDTVGSYWEIIVAVGSFFSSVCISHVFRVFFFFFQKYRREIKKLREKKKRENFGFGYGLMQGMWRALVLGLFTEIDTAKNVINCKCREMVILIKSFCLFVLFFYYSFCKQTPCQMDKIKGKKQLSYFEFWEIFLYIEIGFFEII